MKKYEFTGEVKIWLGRTLRRIRALIAFGDVEAGEAGGWIEKEENLAQDGDAWVYGDARVYGNARVCRRTHILTIGPIGSRNDTTTFFRTKSLEIYVKCGCFNGNIEAFAEKVKATHGENEHAKRYMLAVELAKACIDLTPCEEPEA